MNTKLYVLKLLPEGDISVTFIGTPDGTSDVDVEKFVETVEEGHTRS